MSNDDTSNELASHVEIAKRILNRIDNWWPIAEQVRGGAGKIPPVATLILPDTVWKNLTKQQQISLTFYAENMVNDVRSNPAKYLTVSPSAPIYSSMLASYRRINDGFWEIIIGRFIDEDPKKLMIDKRIVRGDNFWDHEQDKSVICASFFRQTTEKQNPSKLIPNAQNAVVDIRKLRDYCLNLKHDEGKHKTRLFSSILGITSADAENLRKILLEKVKSQEVQPGRRDEFGQRYTIDFKLKWKGRSANIRSGWIIEHNSNIPKLTTCYPL